MRHACAVLVWLIAFSPLAHGQKKPPDPVEIYVLYTVPYVESCTWMDDLMRKTCAWVRPLPPGRTHACELPVESFRERVAANYAAFRQRFATSIKALEPDLAEMRSTTQRSLDRQYARMLAGEVSMLDLESLGRELRGACVTVERQWLAPTRWPK